MTCPDDVTLDALYSGRLVAEQQQALRLHLDGCDRCRRLAALLAQLRSAESLDDPQTDADAAVSPGARVGRYLIVRLLGAGGMGKVWSAVDPELDRLVALKVVDPDATNPDGEARLLREAQTLARVSHPNVVHVYDVGRLGDRVFVAMERMEGGTLAQWVTAKRRSWRAVLTALCAAGEGLSAAHRAGVIHRDFKPSNVLLSAEGRVCVSDFGLAASREEPTGDGRPAVTPAGTKHYAAPEQLQGHPPNAASDQYSFCVAAMQLLPNAPRRVQSVLQRGRRHDVEARHADMVTLVRRLRATMTRRSAASTLALGAVGAGAIAATATARHAPAACDTVDAAAPQWGPASRARAQRALADVTDPATTDRALDRLDGHVARWRATYAEICPADLRTTRVGRCLRQQAEEIDTTIAWLHEGAPAGASPITVIAALPQADGCRLGELSVVPPEPSAVPAVADIAPGLGEFDALLRQERFDAARQVLARLNARAASVRHPSTAAQLQLRAWALASADGDPHTERAAAETAARHAIEGRDDRLLADAWMSLMWVEGIKLSNDAAADRIRTWLEAFRRAGRLSPDGERRLYQIVANIEVSRGRLPEAAAAYDVVLQHAAHDPEAAAPWVAEARLHAAATHAELGDTERARQQGKAALASTEALYGAESGYARRAHFELTGIFLACGDIEAASRHATRAIAMTERDLPPGHPQRAEALELDGRVRMQTQPPDFEGALAKFDQARAAYAAAIGQTHPVTLGNAINTLTVQLALGRPEDAEAGAVAQLQRIATHLGRDHLLWATVKEVHASALFDQARLVEARAAYQEAIDAYARSLGPEHIGALSARLGLAHTQARLGEDVRPWLSAVLGDEGPPLSLELRASARLVLAEAQWAMGSHQEARATAEIAARESAIAASPRAAAEVEAWLERATGREHANARD